MANQKLTTGKNVSSNSAEAKKKRVEETPNQGCVYDGVPYSHGSLKMQAGVRMQCNNGTWNPAKKATPSSSSSTNKGTQ